MNPQSKSEYCGYSAIDFAEYELKNCRESGRAAKYESLSTYLRATSTPHTTRSRSPRTCSVREDEKEDLEDKEVRCSGQCPRQFV